jgi:hypothetical protein
VSVHQEAGERDHGGRGGRGGGGPNLAFQPRALEHRRTHLDVTAGVTSFVPRSVAARGPAGGPAAEPPVTKPAEPLPDLATAPVANGHVDKEKSNSDFRRMLLEEKQ